MSGREQRRHPRYRFRIPAILYRGTQESLLLTEDVGLRGLFLRTDTPPALRQLVRVKLMLPPDELEIVLHGMAVHVVAKDNRHGRAPGVGVQFYALDGEDKRRWEAFIRHVQSAHPESARRVVSVAPPGAPDPVQRGGERFPVEVKVNVRTLDQLHTLYTRDVSRGGMFLKTELDLDPGTALRFQVIHPETGEAFALDCVVRRRVQKGDVTGLGVEFVGLDDARREAFLAFIGLPPPAGPSP